MIKVLGYIFLAILLMIGGALIFVRTVGHDPAIWHVDPMTAPTPETPNSWRVSPPGAPDSPASEAARIYAASALDLARALDKAAMAEPDTIRLAGSPEAGFTTYVQRTRLVKYPDYISVRTIDLGEGRSTMAILSRSRFGQSDMGVNKARVQRWLQALEPMEAPPAELPQPQG